MRESSISGRILLTLGVSILAIEAVILGFSAMNQRQALLDHYLFQADIVAKTLGYQEEVDSESVRAAQSRLAADHVLSIRPASGPADAGGPGREGWQQSSFGGVYREEGNQLVYRLNHLEVVVDITGIGPALRQYALRITGLVAIIVAFVTGAVYALLRPHLVVPLRRLEARLTAISGAEADLTDRLPVNRNDEIGRISSRFNEFSEKLRVIVETIQSTAGELSRSVEKLSGLSQTTDDNAVANRDLVQQMRDELKELDVRLQETAPSVKSITSSIGALSESVDRAVAAISESRAAVEEMDASVRSLDGIAKEKKTVTDSLVSLAVDAGGEMNNSVQAIESVESSTQDMLDMIDVINTVADQTSLLAMNAAIEAAHAGEAGKGFAVVADEIRKLSELSAENAGKINTSLRKDIDQIHQAGEINRSARDAFERIVGSVQDVAQAMGEMMAGLNEQAAASADIVKALSAIQEVTGTVQDESNSISREAETISGTVERLAASSRDVASNASQVTDRIAAIAKSMQELNDVVQSETREAERLNAQVGQFKTEYESA